MYIRYSSNTNTQYSYVAPVISSYYTSPYYTYQYSHGSWSPSYNNNYNNTNNGYYYVTSPTVSVGYTDTNYNNGYGYGNYYDNGMSSIPSNPCYYVNGYYTCQ